MSKQNELAQLADAVTVDDGNVGIGVTPSSWSLGKALHIGNAENSLWGEGDYALHMVQNAYYNSGWKYTHSDAATMYSQSDGGHYWYQAGNGTVDNAVSWSTPMRIDSSGNVLIGTTSPTNTNVGGATFHNYTSSFGRSILALGSTTTATGAELMWFFNPNGRVGRIDTNANSTSFITTSDYRLKTDAQPMTGASARVQALNPVNFEWLSDGSRADGFLAHEAQTVVPESVSGAKDAMKDEEYEVTPAVLDEDGNVTTEAVMGTRSVPDYQGIDQSKLVPLLTAALQEALTEIASLKTRVEALEA